MWARVIEFSLASWLAISPFIFRYPNTPRAPWFNDLIVSSLIALFALLSFYSPLRKLHLANLAVSFYLMLLVFLTPERALSPPYQNYMVLGLLLLMISTIPTDASKPPRPWRDFYKNSK